MPAGVSFACVRTRARRREKAWRIIAGEGDGGRLEDGNRN